VDQLLHQSTMTKFGMRRGDDDKQIEKMTSVLASSICLNLLKHVAFYSHSKKVRDFSPAALLTAIADEHATNECYHKVGDTQLVAHLYEVIGVIQMAVRDCRCGLFALSKVASDERKVGDTNYVMRFVNLTFQEYLAGLFLIDQLQHALSKQMLQQKMVDLKLISESEGLLEDAWWRGVFLSMPGSMSQVLFEAITTNLLKDGSESNLELLADMLEDMNSGNIKPNIKHQMKTRYDNATSDKDLFEGLTHQSRNLQYLCLNQIMRFSDPVRAACLVAFQIDSANLTLSTLHDSPWYRRASAARALGLMGEVKTHSLILQVLINMYERVLAAGRVRR